jgi:hypothetical protein
MMSLPAGLFQRVQPLGAAPEELKGMITPEGIGAERRRSIPHHFAIVEMSTPKTLARSKFSLLSSFDISAIVPPYPISA